MLISSPNARHYDLVRSLSPCAIKSLRALPALGGFSDAFSNFLKADMGILCDPEKVRFGFLIAAAINASFLGTCSGIHDIKKQLSQHRVDKGDYLVYEPQLLLV